MVLGVPVGLTVGGLLSDRWGDAAAFEIAGAAVVLALFAAWVRVPDLRAPIARRPPLVETIRAMTDRRLLAIGGINFALSFAAGGMILTTLALLVHSRHLAIFGRNEQGTAGLLMGVMCILDACATPLAGRLGDRFHAHAQVASAGLFLLVPGLIVVGLAPGAWGFAGGLALIGLGAAGLGPSLLVMMGQIVPRERRGTGAGLLQFSGDIGGMLGPLVGTALFAGSASIPYLATAALVACFIPAALWLAKRERSHCELAAVEQPAVGRAGA
jgi:MFS family permease